MKLSSLRKRLLVFLIAAVSLLAVRVCVDWAWPLNFTTQLVLLLIITIGYFLLVPSKKAPYCKSVISITILSLLLFSQYIRIVQIGESVAVISPFQDDPYLEGTRVFREKLERYSKVEKITGLSHVILDQRIESEVEAQNLLRSHSASKTEAVIWGSKKWIVVSFKETPPIIISENSASTQYAHLYGFWIASSVSKIGLRFEPSDETARFLTDLIGGIAILNRDSISPSSKIEAELLLKASGTQRSFWTSFAHTTYALWRLGTWMLEDGLKEGDTNKIKCASGILKTGLRVLKPTDNPELAAALWNNYGVSLVALKSSRKGAVPKFAVKAFRKAKKSLELKSPYRLRSSNIRSSVLNLAQVRFLRSGSLEGRRGASKKRRDGKRRENRKRAASSLP